MKNRKSITSHRFLLTLAATLFFGSVTASAAAIAAGGNTVTDNISKTTYDTSTTFTGSATSFTGRTDNYSVGYYIDNGKTVASKSLLTASDAAISTLNLDLDTTGYGFNPVIATGSNTLLSLSGRIFCMDTSDGSHASDFSGLGSQIIASNYAKVTINNMNIHTTGFLRDAFIADNHAQITVKDSTVTTMGANPLTQAYSGYKNSANQSIMLSPPWVLGIQGGARSANVLGNNATLSVIHSAFTSGGWALLSTDSCSNPVVNVLDSTLRILPESEGGMSSGSFPYSSEYGSGYGAYLIGNATENFYGSEISGTTYGAILCGGTANFCSSNKAITLYDADNEKIDTFTGRNQVSSIDSVFGFMSHNNGTINVVDGTKVNSEEAVFLYKAGDVTFHADNAVLKSNSGILLQMMDNDDSTIGATNGNGGPVFNTTFSEKSGWPSKNGSVSASGGQSNLVNFNLSNGNYTGNIYNGTGYYNQSGDTLNVTLGENTSLNGAIALTETRHIKENGEQNTSFTINEYYYLGHVANRLYNNGNSKIAVTLTGGAVWKLSGTSSITSLKIEKGTIKAPEGKTVTMTVDGVKTEIVKGKTYTGKINLTIS